jgi:hypothetical protein
MRHITLIFLSALILCSALFIGGCGFSEPKSSGPEIPEIDVEADFITVGFEDHSTIELTKGSPEFEEINDEAIRIYQNIWGIMEELVGPDYLEEVIKYNNKFVEIELTEPVSVTTYTDEGDVYRILELTSVIFVFTGEYSGYPLNKGHTTPEWPEWGVYVSRRSFSNLEKMVDALLS